MEVRYSLSDLLKVAVNTYYGNLDESENTLYEMKEDLYEKFKDVVSIRPLKWEDFSISRSELDPDFIVDWGEFWKTVATKFKEDIDSSINFKTDYKTLDELLNNYWLWVVEYSWYQPKFYNYEHDRVNITIELKDENWNLKKYWLEKLAQQYIDEVRIGSYDWYCSFEPDNIDNVKRHDMCVLWVILQKENVFNFIKSELEELIKNNSYEWYNNSIAKKYYTRRIDTKPELWDKYASDRFELHYYTYNYWDDYLLEVEESTIF